MSSFTNSTIKVLAVGALVLGAGVYYQNFAAYRAHEAQEALRKVDAAQSQAERTRQLAEQYVDLLESMADRKIDRQEPFSVDSEFSPQEISQVGPLLGTLYQRDGHFFLRRFQMTWRDGDSKLGLLPRVAVELEGQKVLLFSDEPAAAGSSVASVKP